MSTSTEEKPTGTDAGTGAPALDLSLWDKVGDFFNGLSDGTAQFLTRLFGSSNERQVRKLGYVRARDGSYQVTPGSVLARVNELEPKMRALSNDELKGLTPKFRERLAKGEALEDLLPEAFAACREAGRRYKDMRHFDVQILGGCVLHDGNIAEMVTGEGKTLVATLPAYLNALVGKGVHIVTVNDYLARRDCEWMTPIYQGVGITAGYIQSDMDPAARRKAYDCDITYGTNSEFGFDYLRDNMKPARWGDDRHYAVWQQQCQKNLNYAIIDEVDNILIDEARTPLIISGMAFGDINRFKVADRIARQLKKEVHFEVKEKEHTCHLTEEGTHEAEKLAGVESFYTAGNMEWPHLIDQALKAHHLYKKDKQYVVMPHPDPQEQGRMSVIIVDEFTGRLMVGRQWSDGLHQAVEAKENVPIKEETQTVATVTIQNFFKLYKKLAGMTGTAMTEANEFWKIYKLDVVAIPTNKPLHRINHTDVIFRYEREKWKAIVDELVEVNKSGRPILVGTVDVAKSEKLNDMLKRKGIKCELLNAKPEYAAREAEIVAQAGRIGAVTISTNMAGRGTDIILGGNPEFMAWSKLKNDYASRLDVPPDVWKKTVDEIEAKEKTREEGRKVAEMGGLHIVGTERHEARRIDNQLRGRSGRQGDPGSSRFFLSLQDDLMRIFAGEWVSAMLTKLGMQEGEAIESAMVARRVEAAQKKVEERNFDIRKHLLEYDEVMDHQRKRVYGYRQDILEGVNCKLLIVDMLDDQIETTVNRCLDDKYAAESFAEYASNRLGVEFESADFHRATFEEAERTAREKALRQANLMLEDAMEENLNPEVDPKEWNWEALANFLGSRWGVKVNSRELKQAGRDGLVEHLLPKIEQALTAVSLTDGGEMLDPAFGRKAISDWMRLKFQLAVSVDELKDQEGPDLKSFLLDRIMRLYTEKEIAFPVQVGLAKFMAERVVGGMKKYDRDGLYAWARERFGAFGKDLNETDFRTQSRTRLGEILTDVAKRFFVLDGQQRISAELDRAFGSSEFLGEAEAKELAAWAKEALQLDVELARLQGLSRTSARQAMYNVFDDRYRPEMRAMERSLVLNMLDSSWKDHLYAMDHLRAGIGLVGYAQVDPKTEYKRQGMKIFEEMWDGVQVKVTDLIFRMEEAADSFAEAILQTSEASHAQAERPTAAPAASDGIRAQQDQAIAGSQQTKKIDPIRNRRPNVGRNDPCPCGSGKKYKNCCMRTAV